MVAGLAWLTMTAPTMAAEVYKYIDENGKVHYSDHPYTYLQKNFQSSGGENTTYDKKHDTLEKGDLVGHWDLVAHSLHLGNDTVPSSGSWDFSNNGKLLITRDANGAPSKKNVRVNNNNTEYRTQGRILEIIDSGKWLPYRIVLLSSTRLIIRTGDHGEYLYFAKNSTVKILTSPDGKMVKESLYRRDQVATLLIMFSCTGIQFNELSTEEKKDKLKEIFTMTGIEKFNEKTFTDSVEHYKKDTIFKEQYKPHITSETKNCLVPKINLE